MTFFVQTMETKGSLRFEIIINALVRALSAAFENLFYGSAVNIIFSLNTYFTGLRSIEYYR